jgi:uncharacterized sporulation protein YeaH/YhbH (DUF444 family)
VRRAVAQRDIRHIEQARTSPSPEGHHEPVFTTARRRARHGAPGNVDRARRPHRAPQGGGGGAGRQASDSGEGEDDFTFTLTKEEFMQLFFEDLALPRLLRTHIGETPQYKTRRAGFSHDGTPTTWRGAHHARRPGPAHRAGQAGQPRAAGAAEQLDDLLAQDDGTSEAAAELQQRIEALRARLAAFLDPIDLRFRNRTRVPVPSSQAVMFCLMDVSGSMDEQRKDLAKRFFILLYLFLTRHYEKIEMVFIRHHTQADEVDEDTSFTPPKAAAPVVSSALVLLEQIMRALPGAGLEHLRRPGQRRRQLRRRQRHLPQAAGRQDPAAGALLRLRAGGARGAEPVAAVQPAAAAVSWFAMRKVDEAGEIYPVFRELFKKEGLLMILSMYPVLERRSGHRKPGGAGERARRADRRCPPASAPRTRCPTRATGPSS